MKNSSPTIALLSATMVTIVTKEQFYVFQFMIRILLAVTIVITTLFQKFRILYLFSNRFLKLVLDK